MQILRRISQGITRNLPSLSSYFGNTWQRFIQNERFKMSIKGTKGIHFEFSLRSKLQLILARKDVRNSLFLFSLFFFQKFAKFSRFPSDVIWEVSICCATRCRRASYLTLSSSTVKRKLYLTRARDRASRPRDCSLTLENISNKNEPVYTGNKRERKKRKSCG